MTARVVARLLALVIAGAAVIDPAIPFTRPVRPLVSVIAAEPSDSAAAARVRRALRADFDVLDAAFAGADASVLVGRRLPRDVELAGRPVFAALPPPHGIRIESFELPRTAQVDAVVPVNAALLVAGPPGRTVVVSLMAGPLEVDRLELQASPETGRLAVRLAWIPPDTGATRLRIVARSGEDAAAADAVIDVRDARTAVLFHDARPSWLSTFVRRSIERDPRFIVTSRTITSPGISTDAGRPPAGITDPGALASFDVIVIGAPESLAEREIDGLESWMRRTGGSALLLLDRPVEGAWQRLVGAAPWEMVTVDAGIVVHGPADSLRATELYSPVRLVPAARTVARVDATDDGRARPILWTAPVGAGRLMVSGALDAWRYRDPATSNFDVFWRTRIAELGAAASPNLVVRVPDSVVPPDARTEVEVVVRDAALADLTGGDTVRTTIAATIDSPAGEVPVHLWPAGEPGRFRGVVRAPNEPGDYRVRVTNGDAQARALIAVESSPAHASPDEADLVAAWTRAHGGRIFEAEEVDRLAGSLLDTLQPTSRRVPWHPMRSAWWIVPFTLALGLEWWLRRRRGLA